MKNKKPNATQIWKHFEDFLVPRLRLSITDRAVYSHLLRHSRLEGRTRLRFSISWLARGARLSGARITEQTSPLHVLATCSAAPRVEASRLLVDHPWDRRPMVANDHRVGIANS